MIYEVRARLFFEKKDEALDFYHDCVTAHSKGVDVNPDGENAEIRTIDLVENHHDENPTASCHVLMSVP